MEYSARIQRDYRRLMQRRSGFEKRVETEIERGIDDYRARFSKMRREGDRPLSILAEGDSWFRYGVGFAVIYHLENLLDIEIMNLAKPGDEARKMLTGKQARRLQRELGRGPERRFKYDYLLFSGGGNDLVGEDTFYKWLHPYEKGMTPRQMINSATLSDALKLLGCDYQNLLAIRKAAKSERTHILLHGYDFAYPNGDGVCWFGPWLEPGLTYRNAPPSLDYRAEVVAEFLKRFGALLDRIAKPHQNVHVVPTQGTLTGLSEWHNELHPRKRGFEKIAKKFLNVISQIEG